MMETASISETSLNLYNTTRHKNPQDSHLRVITFPTKLAVPIPFILFGVLRRKWVENIETEVMYERNGV
jgi:hypothetical protein